MEKENHVRDIVLYDVKSVQELFGLGRTNTYSLMTSDGFPSFRLNNKLYVESEALRKWIECNRGKSYKY